METGISSARRRAATVSLLCLLSGFVGGCDGPVNSPKGITLDAAGATFPAALYERWYRDFSQDHPGSAVRYDAVGSGAGIQLFTDDLVDFGASDDSLTEQEMAQVDRGVRQLPMTSGAIALAYNLQDAQGEPIKQLRLSRKAYVGIFLGEIVRWNDEEIAIHNPDIDLPDIPIQVEYRLDSSGTTSALTRHLSKLSDRWKSGPGSGRKITWPVGAGMPTDRGVARGIRQVSGSIGYLSYAYASEQRLPMATLQNKAGSFVQPALPSIQAGLSDADPGHGQMQMSVADPESADAYPIVTYSWILCYRVYDDPRKLTALKEYLRYGLQEGQEVSSELGYVPMPEAIVSSSLGLLDEITLSQSADTATAVSASKTAPSSSLLSLETDDEKQPEKVKAGKKTEESVDAVEDDISVEQAAKKDSQADVESSDEPDQVEAQDIAEPEPPIEPQESSANDTPTPSPEEDHDQTPGDE